MKNNLSGPSLYYVSDKNIFDALNQSRVDTETVRRMFERRNIVCSKKTPREHLARYFSTLTHDYLDHQDIAEKLGSISRRERTTTLEIQNPITSDNLEQALSKLTDTLRQTGDIVSISKDGKHVSINIRYTEVDYRQSEFRQVQHKDGVIELAILDKSITVRSTQNEYIGLATNQLIQQLEKEAGNTLDISKITLSGYTAPKIRSKFFHDLSNTLPGFSRRDVTDVYVHKAGSAAQGDALSQDDAVEDDEGDVQKILMKGSSVTRSRVLGDLLKDDKYFIFRISWLAIETLGAGYGYVVEAMFNDPLDCREFAYIVKGVHALESPAKLTKHRRLPTKDESDLVAKAIEGRAKELIAELAQSAIIQSGA